MQPGRRKQKGPVRYILNVVLFHRLAVDESSKALCRGATNEMIDVLYLPGVWCMGNTETSRQEEEDKRLSALVNRRSRVMGTFF
jgi:hypothetical protein